MPKFSLNIRWLFLALPLIALWPGGPLAAAQDTYPKLANYYLKYYDLVTPDELTQAKKWDLLILPNEISMKFPEFIRAFKAAGPEKTVIAYNTPGMVLHLPHTLYKKVDDANLWLRGGAGEKLEVWNNLFTVNATSSAWQNMYVASVGDTYRQAPWDGSFYDTFESTIDRYSTDGIDIDGDGRVDPPATVNTRWRQALISILQKTRDAYPDKAIVMNGTSDSYYQPNVNGRMFESFPAWWEGGPSYWQSSMYNYLRRLPPLNKQPNYYVINSNTNGQQGMDAYQKMRFGLTSTLLGDGYYSFSYGLTHEQLWWYDEYDVKLGRADSSYFNLLKPQSDYIEPGLWRRDFENGISLVNSTDKTQLYVFNREQFEKIHGTQDRLVNDGTTVNYVKLAPSDGIILRRVKQDIVASSFSNGDLVRSFDITGSQLRNGFFAYRPDINAGVNVIIDDLDADGRREKLYEKSGKLLVASPGRATVTIAPFGAKFAGRLSFATADFDRDGNREIVVAPASGGGPQVLIFNRSGKLLSPGFFAFDKSFRGGVKLSAGDVNNDGRDDIVAAPVSSLAPQIRIFSDKGRLTGSFLAYAQSYRGGVNTAVGDIDGDGKNELVTGAAAGGPHVRIFTSGGQLRGQFMAFDPSGRTGVRVMISDVDGDGKNEILAGTANF